MMFQEADAGQTKPQVNLGPHGLGDPSDRRLRKVEREVMIPKLMREVAKNEKCIEEVAAFTKCCSANGVLMAIKCRPENSSLQACLTNWYRNEQFISDCTEEYLKERSEYRATGIPKKHRVTKL